MPSTDTDGHVTIVTDVRVTVANSMSRGSFLNEVDTSDHDTVDDYVESLEDLLEVQVQTLFDNVDEFRSLNVDAEVDGDVATLFVGGDDCR